MLKKSKKLSPELEEKRKAKQARNKEILKAFKVNVKRSQIKAPTEKDLVFCISLYVGLPKRFSIKNVSYRMYLSEVVSKRGFLEKVAKEDIDIILDYFYTVPYQSKIELSKQYFKGNTSKGQKVINKYLRALVNEIMQDFKEGKLKVKEYQKPRTKREERKALNELLKKQGINIKVPLRVESKKEKNKKADK